MSLYVVLMGVQGAGKGEQAKFITAEYSIPHISTGDLFRAMKTRTDALARQVQEIMNRGELISDDITEAVVTDRLSQPDATNGVLFDGFPRTVGQAKWLTDYLKGHQTGVTAAILLDLDLYTAFKRAYGRVYTSDMQNSYNIYSKADGIQWTFVKDPEGKFPPRLDGTETATGKPLIRRPDDADAAAVIKRIDTYMVDTAPLVA